MASKPTIEGELCDSGYISDNENLANSQLTNSVQNLNVIQQLEDTVPLRDAGLDNAPKTNQDHSHINQVTQRAGTEVNHEGERETVGQESVN